MIGAGGAGFHASGARPLHDDYAALQIDLGALRACLLDRTEALAETLLGEPNRALSTRGAARWGSHGSRVLQLDGPKRGLWYDHERGTGGDLIALIGDTLQYDFTAALVWAGDWIGRAKVDLPRPAPRKPTREPVRRANAYAAQLRAEMQPLTGTLAERYLREVRGLGDLPLPPDVGFHPAVGSRDTGSKHPALIVPCLEHGRVVRVQTILLDPKTGGKAVLAQPKLTFGAGYAHVPASFEQRVPSDWVVVTEGPEDAITMNAVTGHRADATLGAGSLGKPQYPPGTKLLIVGDNGGTGHAQAEAAAKAHRMRGADVRVLYPPDDVKDANDLVRERGVEAVRSWIATAMQMPHTAAPLAIPAYYPAPTEDRDAALARQRTSIVQTLRDGVRLTAARREVITRRAAILAQMGETTPGQRGAVTRRVIRAVASERGYGTRLPRPVRHLITGAQASGKTTVALETVAALPAPLVVRMAEPTLEKAVEIGDDYCKVTTGESLPVLVVRGRSTSDPQRPGHQMCDRAEAAEAVARDGRSVIEHMCRDCKLAPACGDQRQRATIAQMARNGGGFFVGATAGLYLPSAIPDADIMIVDERATVEAIEVVTVASSVLDPFGIPGLGIDTRDTLNTLRAAVHQPAALRRLREARIDRAELRKVTKALEHALAEATPDVDGSMSDQEIIDRIEASTRRHIRSALAVVAAVRHEIDQPRHAPTGVQVRDDKIVISRLRRPLGIRHATVLGIDGTGNEALNRRIFGAQLTHERIAIERQMVITGTRGRQYSRQSITGCRADGSLIESRAESSVRLRREVLQIVDSQPGTLLGASKRVIAALLDPQDDRPVAHFNAVRGLNKHERRRRVVALGQESLSIRDLEDLARAFMADDPQPFVSMDHPAPAGWGYRFWPYKATRMRRMRDGTLEPVEVEVHPDPRCQRVLEQIREAEVVQLIDRTRPVFHPREGVLMNNLCLDVTYGKIRTHRELLLGGNPLERAYLATGILPLGAKYLHAAHPRLFSTEKSAAHALEKYPLTVHMNPIYSPGVFVFRAAGQRGQDSRAIIDLTRHADPRTSLTAIVGPLDLFEAVDPPPTPAPPPRDPAAKPAPPRRTPTPPIDLPGMSPNYRRRGIGHRRSGPMDDATREFTHNFATNCGTRWGNTPVLRSDTPEDIPDMSNTPRPRLPPKPQTVSAKPKHGLAPSAKLKPAPAKVAKPTPSPKAATVKPNEAERAAKIAAAERRNRLEQREAIERRAAIRDAQLAVLRERYPAVFNDERPLPLALGVDKHLRVLLGASVRTTLQWWVSQPAYLAAVAAGGPRYGLDGEAVGSISEAQVTLAAAQLRGRSGDRRGMAGGGSGPLSPSPST